MIATDHFVFLHLHKSGGTFVNQWLLRHFAEARRLGIPLNVVDVPAECDFYTPSIVERAPISEACRGVL